MKRIFLVVMVLGLAFYSLAFAAKDIIWMTLSEGTTKAKAEKKPMIVDFFYGTGCQRCEKLVQNVYGNNAVAQRIMADFIPIRIDLTKDLTKEEENLGVKYDYKMECLLLFLTSEGKIISDSDGKGLSCANTIDAEVFIQYLDMVKASL